MGEGENALRRGAGWLDLSERGRIVVRGKDRVRLLHNITTNQVKTLAPGQGCHAFLLNPQGRIQADVYLYCHDGHILIDTEAELTGKVIAHIRRFIVADQVELEDVTSCTAALGLEGPGMAGVLAALHAPLPDTAYAHQTWGRWTVARISLTGQPGVRVFCPAEDKAEAIRQLESAGARPATEAGARLIRIGNGKPRYGEDILETSLPQETQQMDAVSFNKGCYVGQEIVERIRARGHVNRKLVRLEIDATGPLEPGTGLMAGGEEAGEITSSAYSAELGRVVALGYVRTAHAEPGTALQAGGLAARVAYTER